MLKETLLCSLALLGSAALLPADTVTLITGEVFRDATVRSYNVKELKFVDDARRERTVPTWMVARVRPDKPPRLYKEGMDALEMGDTQTALDSLRAFVERTNPSSPQGWMRQLALWNLAIAIVREGTDKSFVEGVVEIEELIKAVPDTAYLPDFYRLKLARYLGSLDAKNIENATKLIENWMAQIRKDELPEAYLHEATVDQILLERDYKKTLKPEAAVTKLKEVINVAGEKSPLATSRAQVEMGWSLLLDRKPEEARPLLDGVIQKGRAMDMTMARAWLGYGHTYFAMKPGRSKDDSKRALYAYMRVPINFKEIGEDGGRGAETVAEALFYARQAYKEWNGPGANEAVGVLRAILKTRYRGTSWANRD